MTIINMRSPPAAGSALPEWGAHTVLVVEDSAVQRAHAVELVRRCGFGTVLEASDGIDALRVLDQHASLPICLVLTDLDMPGMDGLQLIRHLTERQLTEHLVVTSARDPRLLEVVESMGSDNTQMHLLGTVAKPLALGELLPLLQKIGQGGAGAHAPGHAPADLAEIEQGIAQRQFLPYFQPKISIKTGALKGVEALARWQHPQRGMVAPLDFIPAIEGTALMEPFTLLIVEDALRQLVGWHAAGLDKMTLSLNLSADNMASDSFIESLDRLVHAFRLAPEALIWEVTETTIMSNLSQALSNLGRLRLKGFGLAMDDYGVGYSTMQQLARCPFTELKIDRVFVDGAAQRASRRVMLESAIDVGRRLDVTTVAEGVESEADWQLLRELGCDLAQGYLVAKPMAASELFDWTRANRARLQALCGEPKSSRA
jgi:EAL domain-containing protein (putative c-di-GMP-specific phosphodiesterase class I)